MLLGQYDSKIGEKHQVSLPKKFREALGEKLIVTKGFESYLLIVSEENWKTLLEGTEGKPFIDKATRELQRFILGNASEIELDNKGRFVLPEYLRRFAELEIEIVFVGIRRYIEVWDKKKWEEHQENLQNNIGDIAERLVGKDE